MSALAHQFATYEDLFDLPGNLVGEIIHGQLITHPRPVPKHAIAVSYTHLDVYKRQERFRPHRPDHQGYGTRIGVGRVAG